MTNAGTIPDRGLGSTWSTAAAESASSTRRWSTRLGRATFMLGASTWRIEEITRDRVLSRRPEPGGDPVLEGRGPRPALRARRGDRQGLARARGAERRKALERLGSDYFLDDLAARNLLTFIREQEAATGAVPSDRTVVVERPRDEIGDWRSAC